jgi:putative iron-regulated protein
MSQKKILFAILLSISVSACKKNSDKADTENVPVTEQQVLDDFVNVVANPDYADLQTKASVLNQAITLLHSSMTNTNLHTAQDAWRAVRVPWEQSEGFLFGPVEDFLYDPSTDTWPVNTVELDSLLASTNPLAASDIELLQDALKGYHPIEYLLFGVGGTRDISQLGAREMQYLVSLSFNLDSVVNNLKNDWLNPPVNYGAELTTAGNGSTRFATRKDAFLTIVEAMRHICSEVANSKMENPLAEMDSSKAESQYAHNATSDFTNNIVGLQNVYMGRYGSDSGHSLHELVAGKNASLDNIIRSQITAALATMDPIDDNYGLAIFTQQSQILTAQQAIRDLSDKLDLLKQFIDTNIFD